METATQPKWIGAFFDPGYGPDYEGELFESLTHARNVLYDAYHTGYTHPVEHTPLGGEPEAWLMPCVSEAAEYLLYRWDGTLRPVSEYDYPDARIYIGPRGGLRIERL